MNRPPSKVIQTMLLYFRKTSAPRIAKKHLLSTSSIEKSVRDEDTNK